jgi:transcription antitermination factor NusA-like protein
MKLPVCDICAKTGVLCSACESKLSAGSVTEFDVELSRILYELFEGEVGFKRAVDTEDFVVILTDKENVGKIIGKGGAVIRIISKTLGKQVRVVGVGNMEEMIYDFIAPARVRGINKVYKPAGVVTYRVRIDSRDKDKLRINLEGMEKVISSIVGTQVKLSFE